MSQLTPTYRELEVVHPAAKLLVNASQQQEAEVGKLRELS
jgi:hypothetical protein